MHDAMSNGGVHAVGSRKHAPHPIRVSGAMQSSMPVPPLQSPGQFVLFSPPAMSHVLSPHTGPAGWQSLGQLCCVSPFSH